jgi:predicted flap endonuclease-1-like 5' DNA nuclease
MAKLSDIEGIGATYEAKLKEVGIGSLEALLEAGAKASGREKVAKDSGISEKLILTWVNKADLTRVKGISTQYADLLEFANVNTIPQLATRNAGNLLAKMEEVNAERHLVRKIPVLSQVEDWIAQAKELPRVLEY